MPEMSCKIRLFGGRMTPDSKKLHAVTGRKVTHKCEKFSPVNKVFFSLYAEKTAQDEDKICVLS